jgi:hypothetical protein
MAAARFSLRLPAISRAVPARSPPINDPGGSIVWQAVVLGNVLAVLFTLGVFSVATSKFQTAALSLLLIIYLTVRIQDGDLTRLLVGFEITSRQRFLQLRTLAGVPTGTKETQYLERERKKLENPDAKWWANIAGSAVMALIAIYNLVMLAL